VVKALYDWGAENIPGTKPDKAILSLLKTIINLRQRLLAWAIDFRRCSRGSNPTLQPKAEAF